MIDLKPKLKLLGVSNKNISVYAPILATAMDKANINTEPRINAFLAQIAHESGNFVYTKELTNHNTASMRATWSRMFPTDSSTLPYLKNPEKLFNYVYGGRMGNNSQGEGFKYIGRGLIGNTGKNQYVLLGKQMGIDLVNNPQLLQEPKYAVQASVLFWSNKGLNTLADTSNFTKITSLINGGQIGASDRMLKFNLLSGIKNNPIQSTLIFIILFSIFAYAVTQVNK